MSDVPSQPPRLSGRIVLLVLVVLIAALGLAIRLSVR